MVADAFEWAICMWLVAVFFDWVGAMPQKENFYKESLSFHILAIGVMFIIALILFSFAK